VVPDKLNTEGSAASNQSRHEPMDRGSKKGAGLLFCTETGINDGGKGGIDDFVTTEVNISY
jgi:hypothetical protein